MTTLFRRNPGPSISWRNIANKLRARLRRNNSSNRQAASMAAAASMIRLAEQSPSLFDRHALISLSGTPKLKKSSERGLSRLQHLSSNSASSSSKRVETPNTLPATTSTTSSSSARSSRFRPCHSSTTRCAILPAARVTSQASIDPSSTNLNCIPGAFCARRNNAPAMARMVVA